jgi:MSHA biogenesis protein MshP
MRPEPAARLRTNPGAWPLPAVAAGFVLPSAIFLLVVLAALGAYLVSIGTTQQQTLVQDVEGTRAYWAARAAAEYGLALALSPEDTGGPTVFAACPTGVPGGALEGFSITLTCERSPAVGHHVEAGVHLVVYTISATASRGTPGGFGYVERQVRVSAAKCKDPNAALPGGGVDPRFRCG